MAKSHGQQAPDRIQFLVPTQGSWESLEGLQEWFAYPQNSKAQRAVHTQVLALNCWLAENQQSLTWAHSSLHQEKIT